MKLEKDVRRAVLIGLAITAAAVGCALLLTHFWLHFVTDIQPYHVYLSALVLPVIITPVCTFMILRANVRVTRLAKENHRLANEDTLTRLPNRRAFFAETEALRATQAGASEVFVCGIVDIDNFKRVNDEYGHDMGDIVLQGVAASIRDFAMKRGVVARLGGEEFGVAGLFSGATEARLYADALVRAIAMRSHACCGNGLHVTVSLGYCLAAPGESLSSQLSRADAALYEAKRTGKNRAVAAQEIAAPATSAA